MPTNATRTLMTLQHQRGDLIQRFRQHHLFLISEWITTGFTTFVVPLWIAGGSGLPRPDIRAWIEEKQPAYASPKLLARFRDQ